jgi:AraC family transcriptional regulator
VPSKQSVASEVELPRTTDTWSLRHLRVLSWRDWDTFGAGVFDRGEGEGIWRDSRHRLLFSPTARPEMLVQIEGGRTRTLAPQPEVIGFCHAHATVRTAAGDSRYVQVCWDPGLYSTLAPDLPAPPQLEPFSCHDPLLGQLARSLVGEIRQGMLDRLLAESLVTAIAMRVAHRFAAPATPDRPELPRSRLRRVLDYIEANLDQDLTLAELAGVACLSPWHFSRAFKQATSLGPRRYVLRRRIERAQAMLRRGDEVSLAGIAADLRFADQSHFTNTFRRETGTTPARYRAALA